MTGMDRGGQRHQQGPDRCLALDELMMINIIIAFYMYHIKSMAKLLLQLPMQQVRRSWNNIPGLAMLSMTNVAGLHSLRYRHRLCLYHHDSRCCCCQCRRCSPPSMVGCHVACSVVCCPICHPPFLSSCHRQHFCRRPQSPITDLHQPLFYRSCPGHPSPLPLPSMVGCYVLGPPSSIPTEPPN